MEISLTNYFWHAFKVKIPNIDNFVLIYKLSLNFTLINYKLFNDLLKCMF